MTVDEILATEFGRKVTILGPNDCWTWNASTDSSGGGRVRIKGRNYSASKYAYEKANGTLPKGERLGHLCLDSGCVNPGHMAVRSSREMHEARFWTQVKKSDDCWEWTGAPWGEGYGQMRVNGRATLVHRLSFEWSAGPVPVGMVVDHMCWNRLCVRPDHLRLATPSQNQRSQSGPNRRSSTGVRGVTLRANGRYEARMTEGDRRIQIGNFESLEEACEAIRLAREELWGEFAGNG